VALARTGRHPVARLRPAQLFRLAQTKQRQPAPGPGRLSQRGIADPGRYQRSRSPFCRTRSAQAGSRPTRGPRRTPRPLPETRSSRMKLFAATRRLFRILLVVIRYRLDDIILDLPMPWWLRATSYLLPWRWLPRRRSTLSRGARLPLALEGLGPIFIKFGQILSPRRDLLPLDIAEELAMLQDRVPPFDSAMATTLIERQLGAPVGEVFARFDSKPLASASVAQVHAAKLRSGEEVVVKVVRPNLKPIISQDLAWLFLLAKTAERASIDARRLHLVEVVEDYAKTIYDELDLLREAANASQLRRNFQDSPLLYVPQIYWDYCRPQVLVMERIYGVPVTDMARLTEQRTDMKQLAERGVEIFFTQVFRDSFFHADMHPGNSFVSTQQPWNPQYIAVDFGIVGSLTPEDQDYLA